MIRDERIRGKEQGFLGIAVFYPCSLFHHPETSSSLPQQTPRKLHPDLRLEALNGFKDLFECYPFNFG
jgi:hypothetical protein